MKLSLARSHFLENCTIGKLLVDGVDIGLWTLEDVVREVANEPVASWKVPNQTAIPSGSYKVVIDHSAHFGRDLPHILDVPGFDGVRIHPGNTDLDTEGCILVGLEWSGGDFIGRSRDAFEILFSQTLRADNIEIEIG